MQKYIDTELWTSDHETGLITQTGTKTVSQVFKELEAHLEEIDAMPSEYLTQSYGRYSGTEDLHDPFPDYSWIACFPVTGGSEGWYIHVEVINNMDDSRALLYLGKELRTFEDAARIAAECARVLS